MAVTSKILIALITGKKLCKMDASIIRGPRSLDREGVILTRNCFI